MNPFFRRIVLSVWLTLLISVTLTIFLGRFLPVSETGAPLYEAQLVATIDRDLAALLAAGVANPAEQIADRFELEFDMLLTIYVIGPDGADVLQRNLPGPVRLLLESDPERIEERQDLRLVVGVQHAEGYRVVGLRSVFLMAQVLARPGTRTLLLAIMLAVSAVIAYFLTQFIVGPIRYLREAGQRVAAGDLDVRVAHTVGNRQDDIAMLARDFDNMTARIERLLTTQRRLMRDVSHELRSPLARLQALQSLARQRFKADDETHILDRMEAESERLNERIEQILTYARLDALEEIQHQQTDLPDLLETIVDDVLIEIGEEDKTVRYDGPQRLSMAVDAGLLHSAVENVVRNAVRFTAKGTVVQVKLEVGDGRVRILIEDDGPGVPEDAIDQLFEPFFQVDESRSPRQRSSGVGLAIARRAVQLHHGLIGAENRPAGGLRVVIDLPLS